MELSSVTVGAVGAEASRAVVADAADHVDHVDEDPARMAGHPVAGGVIDGVAWRAAHAQELGPGSGPVSDAGDVLVPELVDLRRTHHDVPAAGGHHGEDRP